MWQPLKETKFFFFRVDFCAHFEIAQSAAWFWKTHFVFYIYELFYWYLIYGSLVFQIKFQIIDIDAWSFWTSSQWNWFKNTTLCIFNMWEIENCQWSHLTLLYSNLFYRITQFRCSSSSQPRPRPRVPSWVWRVAST